MNSSSKPAILKTPPPKPSIVRPYVMPPYSRRHMFQDEKARKYWRTFFFVLNPLMEVPAIHLKSIIEDNLITASDCLVRYIVNKNDGKFNFPRIDGYVPFFPADCRDGCYILNEKEWNECFYWSGQSIVEGSSDEEPPTPEQELTDS